MTIKPFLYAIMLLNLLVLVSCNFSEPIKLGYVATLSGRYSDIGLSGKNGVILAIEEANASGGVKGRQIDLVALDDKNSSEIAQQANQELIRKNPAVIIGHITSAMSVAGVNAVNGTDTLLISPTTRTTKLVNIDDNFFSIMAPLDSATLLQARHVRSLGLKKIAAVYDTENLDYTEDWVTQFERNFSGYSGTSVSRWKLQSSDRAAFSSIISQIVAQNPDGILIAAGAIDAALLCQLIRKSSSVPVFLASWAMTKDFINHGGTAAEGVYFSNPVDDEDSFPAYREFRRRYENRFGGQPDFVASYAYETTQVVLSALNRQDDSGKLKKSSLQGMSWFGLWGTASFNQFGDAVRENYIIKVVNGSFQKVDFQ